MSEENTGPEMPPEGAAWNRAEGRTAASVNLDGAPYGFRVTGDAAWDSSSNDFAMFSEAANLEVAAMVKTARLKCRSEPGHSVEAWLETERDRIQATHEEIGDTMVRETIAYALEEAWLEAYGCRYDG